VKRDERSEGSREYSSNEPSEGFPLYLLHVNKNNTLESALQNGQALSQGFVVVVFLPNSITDVDLIENADLVEKVAPDR
jgi:hypothetical protein